MKHKLSFSIFVYSFILIFITLGVWQLYRLEWKLNLISEIALPCVLLSLGFALASFDLVISFKKSIILTFLKNILHPLIAFTISKFFLNLDELLVMTVTLAAALPSGSQTYYFAFRYNSQKELISSNIVLSTFVSFFTLSILIILFDF